MNYKGYQEWFAKFDKYLADNKSNEMLLDISNNLLTFSGTAANAVPVVGPMSTVLFASMTSYMASINRRDKQMHDESEKMITLTMKVSQFDYDKGEVEHEWEVITDELKNLQDLYSKALASNLSMLKIDATTFDQAFSNEGDAEKRYQYLTMIRQRAGDYVAQQKIDSPKDWKEIVYNQMMLIQSLKMRFGQITFNINENISKYSYVFDKYKTDNDIGAQMSALQENLTSLKDTFDKAFDPMDYINSATRMYKVM